MVKTKSKKSEPVMKKSAAPSRLDVNYDDPMKRQNGVSSTLTLSSCFRICNYATGFFGGCVTLSHRQRILSDISISRFIIYVSEFINYVIKVSESSVRGEREKVGQEQPINLITSHWQLGFID